MLWVRKMDLVNLILLLMKGKLNCCKGIRFFKVGRMSAVCNWVLLHINPSLDIKQSEYNEDNVGMLKDQNGGLLNNKIEEDLDQVVQLIQGDLIHAPILKRKPWINFPRVWAARYLGHEIYRALRGKVIIIHIFKKTANKDDRLLLFASPFTEQLRDISFPENSKVETHFAKGMAVCRLLALIATFTLMICVCLASFFYSLIVHRSISHRFRSDVTPKVGIAHCWGGNDNIRSDVYWLRNSGITRDKILFYFHRPDTTSTKEQIKILQKMGFAEPVTLLYLLHPRTIKDFLTSPLKVLSKFKKKTWRPLAIMSWDMARESFFAFRVLVALFFSLNQPNLGWLGIYTFKMIYLVYLWKNFFLDHNIKVHMNHFGDVGIQHTSQSLAMHLTNGINIRSNYSYINARCVEYAREFHVYFPWGRKPRCENNIERLYNQCNVYVGYIFDYLFNMEMDRENIRNLEHCPLRVVVYDEAFDYEYVNEFYNAFFALAQNKGLGLYIKSKTLSRDSLTKLFPGFIEAEKTGNVVVLDNKLSPYMALAYADLAIGLGINSACIEAALYGVPSIYWVHHEYVCPQLEMEGNSRLVFHDLGEVVALLEDALTNRHALDGFGDHSFVLPEIDCFQDGQAGRRVGAYIHSYLRNISRSKNRDKALEACNEEHRLRWGENTVTCHSLEDYEYFTD